jgi:hypothetical protein
MGKAATKTGKGAIRDIWSAARRDHEEMAAAAFADPHPDLPRNGIRPGQWPGAPHDSLPPDCPVEVVGCDNALNVWCRTATGSLVMVEKWDMPTVTKLFAPFINYAMWAWPAFGKKKATDPDTGEVKEVLTVNRVECHRLFTCLGRVASLKPQFDPFTQLRGRGAWKDDAGGFIWHSGDYLWRSVNGRLQNVPPGASEGFIYTRGPAVIHPWDGPVSKEESPARRIFAELRTWEWERPYLDPILVMGWIVTAFMGAALDARPVIFTTGGFGVGKSTMQRLIRFVLRKIVFETSNTTAAGIYQHMKNDALPVMVDEMESKPGSDQAKAVIELARIAYSGDNASRGGADHHGVRFNLYNPFFFSAINPPPMDDQDKSRMVVMNLQKLKPKAGEGRPSFPANPADGRMILRQVMDGWPDFRARGLNSWWNLLADLKGIDSRSIDTYGTLLAAADMVLGADLMEEAGLPVADEERLAEVLQEATADERAARLDNWHKCLNHLLASTIDAWKEGKRPSVGGVFEDLGFAPDQDDLKLARNKLEQVNLGIMPPGWMDGQEGNGPYLCIPADGPQLARLFAGTPWHQGVWAIILKQAPNDVVVRNRARQTVKINGAPRRCLVVDMRAFIRFGESLDGLG